MKEKSQDIKRNGSASLTPPPREKSPIPPTKQDSIKLKRSISHQDKLQSID